jgi:cyclophilin family peptidyl-prolyl cis-trans isomerase
MNRWLAAAAALCAVAGWAPGEEPGLYADFKTARGAFTARLEYGKAPKAVAAFAGLATGGKAWLDGYGNVRIGEPFYDGTIFHRVLPGTAVQGGGVPVPSASWEEAGNGPSTTFGLNASAVLEIPPGGAAEDLGELEFVFTNAAAVPATVSFGGEDAEIVQTNRTRQAVWMVSSSSCALGTVVQTNVFRNEWVANEEPRETVTACTVPLVLALPNPTEEPLVYTNLLYLRWSATNVLEAFAGVATNFSNAGFVYPDAFANGLEHVAGALSMANVLPNGDGSQFFVCATNVPGWNGNYTVFGRVVEGMETVAELASVAVDTNANNRPLEDLVLEKVEIRCVGADAEAFFDRLRAQGLPRVDNVPIALKPAAGGGMAASLEIPARSETVFRRTGDLRRHGWGAWRGEDWGYRGEASATNLVFDAADGGPGFFHASAVLYPDAWTMPGSIRGRTLVLHWTNREPATVERLAFSADWSRQGSGTRVTGETTNAFQLFAYSDQWMSLPYSARLYFMDNQYAHTYTLRWDPGAPEGAFGGILQPHVGEGRYGVSGTFVFEP